MTGRGEGFGWALLLEIAPAALFGGALAFAAATVLAVPFVSPASMAPGAAAGCGAWLALRSFRGARQAFPMPQFEQVALEPDEPDELVLGESELLLDDVLARIEPGSRVVRLFEPKPQPSGELQQLQRNLRSAVRPIPTPPDATEALHEALASLRQSLR